MALHGIILVLWGPRAASKATVPAKPFRSLNGYRRATGAPKPP